MRDMITVREASVLLGYEIPTIYRLAQSGQIKATRNRRQMLVSRRSLRVHARAKRKRNVSRAKLIAWLEAEPTRRIAPGWRA